MSEELTFKVSIAALISGLSSISGGLMVWIKTREDIRALQVEMEGVKGKITENANHGVDIARLQAETESIQNLLGSMDKKLDDIQKAVYRRP